MKDKIIARLKAKYPGVNLSKKRLDAIADKLEKKVKEESEIDEALDDANELMDFAAIAKQDDKVRTLEARVKPEPVKQDPPVEEPTEVKIDEDAPAWAKTLLKQNESLAKEVLALKSGNTQKTRVQIATEKFKDLNADFVQSTLGDLPHLNFEDDAAFDSYLERKVTEGTKLTQTVSNDALGNQTKPVIGDGTPTSKAAAVNDIKAWAEKNNPPQPKTN